MRVFIHHDPNGRIKSIIAIDAPDHMGLSLTPKPGVFVSEVEGVQVKSGTSAHNELKKIIKSQRVQTPIPKSRLDKM